MLYYNIRGQNNLSSLIASSRDFRGVLILKNSLIIEKQPLEINKPDIIIQIEKVYLLVIKYDPDNVLNINETGLFQKLILDYILTIQVRSRGKKSKDQIILVFTVFVSRKKEIVQFISKLKNLQCFKNINQKLLCVIYQYNKTKQITGLIIEEYLRQLDNKIRGEGKKVLLLIDNFSSYKLSIILISKKEGLINV